MTDMDEPVLNGNRNSDSERSPSPSTEERIRNLALDQSYGVLCTQADSQPYGSMVAFSFSDNLSQFVFSTPIATRKYRLLKECENVALVVNNQSSFPGDMLKIEAFTATGKAREIVRDKAELRWTRLLVSKHPQLDKFLESPSTAVFVVDVVRYFHVRSFQEVRQWVPPGDEEA